MAGEASFPQDNLLKFPGGRAAVVGSNVRPVDADLVLGAAGLVAGLALYAEATRTAIANTPIKLPSGALERLAAIAGQADAVAKLIEGEVLADGDVA